MNHPSASLQTAPGTANRPILSVAEAARLTPTHWFAHQGSPVAPTEEPWAPQAIDREAPADFVVGAGACATIQQAVNAAIRSGKTTRQFIHIPPGTYAEAVYVPADAPPLSLLGVGAAPEEVRIELCLDAVMLVEAYARSVNLAGQFVKGDPAWAMFKACASPPLARRIETPASAVVWVQAADFQMANLTITNTLLDSVDGGTHQAVALRSDGDRARFENLRLIGRQDTFFINAGEAPTVPNKLGAYATDRIARASVKDCYVEGDTDYVFGRATAVFEGCEFHSVSTRRERPVIVFAPDTLAHVSRGFLVSDCRITADARLQAARNNFLGRSWDQGAASTGYQPGRTPNGQLLIRDSWIDAAYSATRPWDHAATTNRAHRGNADPARKLDDPAFNRLWEYNNHGPGAAPAAG